MVKLDPVTIEIIENRLIEIGWEAGIALQKTAASPSTVEAKDLGFNIADHLARTVVYSVWMPRHGTTLAYMLRASLQRFGERGIDPGDMILVNNPHDGALHSLDLAVISPVHYRGELIAWTGCACHHLDIGGMSPGRSPEATNWFQEGLIFRPIKLVKRGKLREDLFQFFLDNVRMPRYQGLDLKAQIAANNVAREKILELVERYGVETLKACYEEIISFSEMKTRERIRQLPDGRYEATDFVDYDKVYTLRCTLIVRDDTLTFDFTGTDPQAESFINSALPCTVANVHNIVTCLLIPDVTANEGCFRPIQVILPPGTVLSCLPPAPCSGASTVTGWKTQCLTLQTLSQALARSSLAWRANATWGAGFVDVQVTGLDQQGRWYSMRADQTLQGGGARANKDGFDVANIAGSTNTSIPNVESMEQRYPVLYLKRGILPDSEGAGKFRGGLAGEFVIKLHEVEQAELLPFYFGRDFPAQGLAGGQSGATSLVALKRGSNAEEFLRQQTPSFQELAGEEEVLPQRNPPFRIGRNDVIYARGQGGGGYGDPLERDPNLVLGDVVEGHISPERARQAYGVALDPTTLALDLEATRKLRQSLRTYNRDVPIR